jgi:DNA polymerase
MSRRRIERTYLLDEEGAMAHLEIPGHDRQDPREVKLEELSQVVSACQQCPLGQTRTNIVFGSGNARARVVLIGEAPGRNEDETGQPFVGAAGKKLDDYLERAGLSRDDVFIANVLKCRPPSNRDPRPEEIKACAPFLREQLRSIWPDAIVCLGNFASQFVLRTGKGVTDLRGRLHQAGHFVVSPTYHPSATIYHPDWADLIVEDLSLVRAWLDEHPATPEGEVEEVSS